MKIQKCNIDERYKIEVVNSETARGEAWGTGGAGTAFDLEEEGRICCSFGLFDFVGCVFFLCR